MGYGHWKTPKLEAELAAIRKMHASATPEHYPRANVGLLRMERQDYERQAKEIETILKRRKR